MSEKLDLVARASQCLQSNPHTAQSGLDVIRKSIPSVLLELNKLQNDRERKRDELEREQTSLGRQINAKEDSKNKLKRDINAMEKRKARNEALLNDARRELRNAESDKRDAEKKKSDAVAGTIGGSVGAVVLGILFPPSLAATIPAVVTAASVQIRLLTRAKRRLAMQRGVSIEKMVRFEVLTIRSPIMREIYLHSVANRKVCMRNVVC